jgi:hypothetical protein
LALNRTPGARGTVQKLLRLHPTVFGAPGAYTLRSCGPSKTLDKGLEGLVNRAKQSRPLRTRLKVLMDFSSCGPSKTLEALDFAFSCSTDVEGTRVMYRTKEQKRGVDAPIRPSRVAGCESRLWVSGFGLRI